MEAFVYLRDAGCTKILKLTICAVGWDGDKQQDVEEGISFIIDILKRQANDAYVFFLTPGAARLAFNANISSMYSDHETLSLIFDFTRVIPRICRNCGTQSEGQTERHTVMRLALERGASSLKELLRNNFIEHNDYQACGECKVKDSDNIHQVTEAPDILMVYLARTEQTKHGLVKNTAPVKYTQWLDLDPYVHKDARPVKYQLNGVVHHNGSPEEGHYVSMVQGQARTWVLLDDDSKPRKVPFSHVTDPRKCKALEGSWTPVMLVYTRIRR